MPLQLYNTLTRAKEPFEPAEPGKVKMYVCGVTPYDRSHVGHARCYVTFDVVYRYFLRQGLEVEYVRNFTDVEDKIIKKAVEEGVDFREITEKFIALYHDEMAQIGNLPPTAEPKVTECIPEIVAYVERIVERGLGYVVDGDVYFSVRDLASYGELSGRSLEEMRAGERVDVDDRKRDPMDFALWKSAKPGEPHWPSPWGDGRPGWHIECSVMSTGHLGENFDLHGGGRDLIFPHHENEIAQCKAHGAPALSRCWMHNGFVNVGEEKMSKSLGNIFAIQDVLALYHPQAVRMFLLGTHYRNPLTFTLDRLDEATERAGYYYETLQAARAEAEPTSIDEAGGKIRGEFLAALEDDFNTPLAIGAVSEAFTQANRHLDMRKAKQADRRRAGLGAFLALVDELGEYVGLWKEDPAEVLAGIRDRACRAAGIDADEVDRQIAARIEARQAKDFAKADEIRDALAAKGVELQDSPDGTTWKVRTGAAEAAG